MPNGKVAFMSASASRAEFMKSVAPQDIEVVWVGNDLDENERISLCKDVDAIIAQGGDLSTDFLSNCPRVKLIQTLSAGYDRLDVQGINEMGIPIANNGGSNAISVAEHTIALMINASKRTMSRWHTAVKERRWQEGMVRWEMFEITNKTVGIVGLGRIGKHVAKRLRGFDTRTIYFDIEDMPLEVQQELNAEPVAFEDLLRESDIVTLHLPLTPRTRSMIGQPELEIMKPGAFLINTCRGPVIDELALYHALNNNQIAGAGLDVMEEEPPNPNNPLFDLDNVIITPHIAGPSQDSTERCAEFAYYNIQRVLAGDGPESLVTPEY